MSVYKISSYEVENFEIIKTYIKLYPYWMEIYLSNSSNDRSLILLNLLFVDGILLGESDEDKKIIKDAIMLKNKGLEYIAYSVYYSESGLRNKINLIIKNLNNTVKNLNFFKFHDD